MNLKFNFEVEGFPQEGIEIGEFYQLLSDMLDVVLKDKDEVEISLAMWAGG